MKKNLLLLIFLFVVTGIYAQTYQVNDRVNIKWQNAWYTGRILEVKNNTYLVAYDGYSADWNEYVTTDRLKPIGNSLPTKDGVNIPSTTTTTAPPITSTDYSFSDTASLAWYASIEGTPDLQLSPDGKYIYAASDYGNFKVLDAKHLTLLSQIDLGKYPCTSISVSHDGKYLAIGSNLLSIYQTDDGVNFTLYFTSDAYYSIDKLRFSPTVNELTVSGSPKADYKLTQADVWNVETKNLKFNLIKSSNEYYVFSDVTYSTDGTKIALGISNGNHGVEIYDATTGKLTVKIKTPMDVVACSFSPDGNSIVVGGTDKAISLWSLSTKTVIWKSAWSSQVDGYVYDVAFSSDGKSIAVCGSGIGKPVKIYDAISGKLKNEFGKSNPGGNSVCFSSDLNFIFVGFTTYGDIAKVPVVERMKIN